MRGWRRRAARRSRRTFGTRMETVSCGFGIGLEYTRGYSSKVRGGRRIRTVVGLPPGFELARSPRQPYRSPVAGPGWPWRAGKAAAEASSFWVTAARPRPGAAPAAQPPERILADRGRTASAGPRG